MAKKACRVEWFTMNGARVKPSKAKHEVGKYTFEDVRKTICQTGLSYKVGHLVAKQVGWKNLKSRKIRHWY